MTSNVYGFNVYGMEIWKPVRGYEGLYEITLVATGNDGAPVGGKPATYAFNVVPEPSTYALLGLGAGALALLRWRQRSPQK